jgi:hypothetical protein
MVKNIGSLDKSVRIAVGLALLVMIFVLDTPNRWYGLIGILPIATAFMNYCPLYTLLKTNTLEVKHK